VTSIGCGVKQLWGPFLSVTLQPCELGMLLHIPEHVSQQ
jgi:hypothetical protein